MNSQILKDNCWMCLSGSSFEADAHFGRDKLRNYCEPVVMSDVNQKLRFECDNCNGMTGKTIEWWITARFWKLPGISTIRDSREIKQYFLRMYLPAMALSHKYGRNIDLAKYFTYLNSYKESFENKKRPEVDLWIRFFEHQRLAPEQKRKWKNEEVLSVSGILDDRLKLSAEEIFCFYWDMKWCHVSWNKDAIERVSPFNGLMSVDTYKEAIDKFKVYKI